MTAGHMHPGGRLASGVAVLALAGLLSGCSAGVPDQPGGGAPAGTASAASSSAPASSPAAGEPVQAALKDSAPYQALGPEQQSKIDSLEAMDTGTFEKQSRDDQLAYGAFLREVFPGDGAGTPREGSGAAATKVSASSSGDEIIADEFRKAATARRSVPADSGVMTSGVPAGGNYAKMAPSRVSPLYPESYSQALAPAESSGGTALSRLSEPGRMRVSEESNNFIPYDGSWEQLEFKVIQMQDTQSQANSQYYFAYTPFTNIQGARDGVWVLMLNAGESEDKWIPDLSVID